MRLEPRSYFWICWKVSPTASPNFDWLIASSVRRCRIRVPTCRSAAPLPLARSLSPLFDSLDDFEAGESSELRRRSLNRFHGQKKTGQRRFLAMLWRKARPGREHWAGGPEAYLRAGALARQCLPRRQKPPVRELVTSCVNFVGRQCRSCLCQSLPIRLPELTRSPSRR